MDRVTPKTLLLDLLRVTPRPIPVRHLVAVAALFRLEGNAVRVALTRLVQRGLLMRDERGSYRISAGADSVSRWVDGWRQGERRLRRWNGAWLCLWHPHGDDRGERLRSERALARFGFREGRNQLWVRPDNLRLRLTTLRAELDQHGAAASAVLFVGHELPRGVVDGWVGSLWPADEVAAQHRSARRAIRRSRATLDRLTPSDALVESFLIGGGAIHSLAGDPLLPDEIAPGADRRALTEAMLDYDRRAREIWNRFLDSDVLEVSPSHTSALGAEQDGGNSDEHPL